MPVSGELIAGALAGLAFVGCSLSSASPTPSPVPGRRREVVVNGKRVKTVDIHAHTIVPEAAAVINPLETTIALSHLIFEGTLDRFPGLKICAAHGGGFLPSYANRSDAVITTFPNRVGPLPKKKPTQYLKDGQLYFDTIMFTGEAMRHLIAETGIGQIMIGTDYPFPWNKVPVDHVMSIPGLSDDDRIAILGGTAAKLLGIG